MPRSLNTPLTVYETGFILTTRRFASLRFASLRFASLASPPQVVPDAPLGLVDAATNDLQEVYRYDDGGCAAKIITHEARLTGDTTRDTTRETTKDTASTTQGPTGSGGGGGGGGGGGSSNSNGDAAYAIEVTWGEFEGLAHPQMGDAITMWTFSDSNSSSDVLLPATGPAFSDGPHARSSDKAGSSASSSYEVLYNLFDYFDPVTERGLLSDGRW